MQNRALPSNTQVAGEPDILYKAFLGTIKLENISGSGMAIRILPDMFHDPGHKLFTEGAVILCRLVYCLPHDEENSAVFWSTAQITKIREESDNRKSDSTACIVGMKFSNWAQEQGSGSLLWFPVVPMSGVTPIIQWVTRLDISQYRYYWGSRK